MRILRGLGFGAAALWLMVSACLAEEIRFGDGGSIHGGATWTITPNDHVRFDAYSFDGSLAAREGWVWDNRDAKVGHITFAIPGAFASAAEIAREGLGGIGAAPDYQSDCVDAGSLIMEVAAEGVSYAAYLDNCAGQDGAPADVKAHYQALRAVRAEIVAVLGLDRLK